MLTTSRSKIFRVKSVDGMQTFMRILKESHDGYQILITSSSEGRDRTSEEFISRDLVESCLRTGYLTEVDAVTSHMFP
ncbi:MAG TPA: hypothetical protein VMW73_12430 [Spirochaetia bacterium]|nr:hypothetical protein [Spirochaetia bacterium]